MAIKNNIKSVEMNRHAQKNMSTMWPLKISQAKLLVSCYNEMKLPDMLPTEVSENIIFSYQPEYDADRVLVEMAINSK